MLSKKDSAVLGALFDAEASLSSNREKTIISNTPSHSQNNLRRKEINAVKLLNTECPEPDAIREVIIVLSSIIREQPTYSSAYNNRAQALRMLPSTPGNVGQTLIDLGQAIVLAAPQNELAAVSEDDARVLASAHTHRGYILMKAAAKQQFYSTLKEADPRFAGLQSPELEALASKDFTTAGKYGNKTAQSMAVKTNPYAKLCGSIVREALQKEIRDYAILQDNPGIAR